VDPHRFLSRVLPNSTRGPELLPFLLPFLVHPACSLALSLSRNSPTAAAALRQVCAAAGLVASSFPSPGLRRRRAPARYALFSPLSCAVRNRASELLRSNKLGQPLLSGCRITRQNPLNCHNSINLLLFYQPILFCLHRLQIKSVVQDPPRISLEYNRIYAPVQRRNSSAM